VPPQPNCPPAGVLLWSKQYEPRRVVLHCRLPVTWRQRINSSYLCYTSRLVPQLQATVKFHGVFTSRWASLAFAPGKSFRRVPDGDSGNLVAPFMQAVIETARHFAQHVTFILYRITYLTIVGRTTHFWLSLHIAMQLGLYLHHE
jgi:hypothetical protein